MKKTTEETYNPNYDPSTEKHFWFNPSCSDFYEKQDIKDQNDARKARLSLVKKIEKIIQINGGKNLYEDIKFEWSEGCGGNVPWFYTSLHKQGKNGIILIQFRAGHDRKDHDSIWVILGRYQDNLCAYWGIVKKLTKLEEKVNP